MNPSDQELVQFVLRESRLLDRGRYDEWLGLFASEGRYWVPLGGAAQSPDARGASIADEDRLLLSLRIERLKNPRAFSQHPRSHAQHILQTPQVESRDDVARRYVLYTPFLYAEARGEQQTLLAGHWQHDLCLEDGALRIALKRVNLLNSGAPLPAIQLFP